MFDSALELELTRRGLTIVRVGVGSQMEVCVQSGEVETCQTHWFDRQYLCPGFDCPACGTYAGRLSVFLVVTVRSQALWVPGLLELTAASWSRVRMLAQMESLSVTSGLVLGLSRSSVRRGVRAEPIGSGGVVSPELVTRERLIDAISLLFKLPARVAEETAAAWCERMRPAVVGQMASAIRRVG